MTAVEPPRSPWLRAAAAAPSFLVALWFAGHALVFLRQGHRLTEEMRSLAAWPLYELLASGFGIALPVAAACGGALLYRSRGMPGRGSRTLVTALVLLPLCGLVLATSGSGEAWYTLLFLAFAFAHWAAFESSASAADEGDDRRPSPLARSVFAFVKCYGFAVLAFLLSGFVVVLPLDVWGSRIPDAGRMHFLSVAVGAVYYSLLGIANLVDLEGRLERGRILARAQAEAEAAWSHRPPDAPPPAIDPPPDAWLRPDLADPGATPGVGFAHAASERWVGALPVGDAARKQIQYWDRGTVRFGDRYRAKVLERRAMLVLALAALFGLVLCVVVAAHPASFRNRRERPRSPLLPPPSHSEQDAREAFWAMAVVALLVGAGCGARAWVLRQPTLGRARVVVDRGRGIVQRLGVEPLYIGAAELVAACGAEPDSDRLWRLAAREGDHEVLLVEGVAQRDAEVLGQQLLAAGFQRLRRDLTPASSAT